MVAGIMGELPWWAQRRDVVTVCDVIRAGACADGVRDWIAAQDLGGRVALPIADALALADDSARPYVESGSGSGSGYGYGDGSGSGDDGMVGVEEA